MHGKGSREETELNNTTQHNGAARRGDHDVSNTFTETDGRGHFQVRFFCNE
jgi:hypothetical protein